MILPPGGAPVDTNRRAKLRGVLNPREVVQRIDKLVDRDQVRLTEIFSDEAKPSIPSEKPHAIRGRLC